MFHLLKYHYLAICLSLLGLSTISLNGDCGCNRVTANGLSFGRFFGASSSDADVGPPSTFAGQNFSLFRDHVDDLQNGQFYLNASYLSPSDFEIEIEENVWTDLTAISSSSVPSSDTSSSGFVSLTGNINYIEVIVDDGEPVRFDVAGDQEDYVDYTIEDGSLEIRKRGCFTNVSVNRFFNAEPITASIRVIKKKDLNGGEYESNSNQPDGDTGPGTPPTLPPGSTNPPNYAPPGPLATDTFSSGLAPTVDATNNPLGNTTNGMIGWTADSASQAISLNALKLPGASPITNFFKPGTQFYRDGNRLQYYYGNQLFDAVEATNSLTLKFYPINLNAEGIPQNLGEKDQAGFYAPDVPVSRTVTYVRTGNTVLVSESGTSVPSRDTHLLTWLVGPNGEKTHIWEDLLNPKRFVTIRSAASTELTHPVVVDEEWDTQGSGPDVLMSRVSREYEPFIVAGSNPLRVDYRLIQSIVDPGVGQGFENLTETTHYNGDGKVDLTTTADGSWNYTSRGGDANFSHNASRPYPTIEYSPWLNSPAPSVGELPSIQGSVAEVSYNTYTSAPPNYISTKHIDIYTAGYLTAKEEILTVYADGYTTVTTRKYHTKDAYTETKTQTYPSNTPAPNTNRLFRSIDSSGRTMTYRYVKMQLNSVDGTYIEDETGSNPLATYRGTYVTEGVVGNEDGQLDAAGNSLTTRTVTINDQNGDTVRVEKQAYKGPNDYEVMTTTTYERLVNPLTGYLEKIITRQDGRIISEEEYLPGRVTQTTDENGIVETATNDAAGRLSTVVSRGITTTYLKTGLTSTVTQTAPGMPARSSSSTRNVAGDTVSETDEASTVTSYSKDRAARTETITRNGVTTVSKHYADGQAMSTSGTGVIPSYTTYEVDSATGFITTISSTGSATSHSPRWTKTTTDLAGRTVSIRTPGTPGINSTRNSEPVITYAYNPAPGVKMMTTNSAGPSPQLSLSDALGRTQSNGLDADGDDALSAAAGDRFSTSQSYYQKIADAWWEIRTQTTPISATSSRSSTSSRRMKEDIGEVSESSDSTGTTTSTRSFDRTNQTTTTTLVIPGGQTLTSIEVAGRLIQKGVPGMTTPETYQYDNYGRENLRTDPRGASTWSFGYNAFNQLEYVRDQLGNVTTYRYYPANHPNAGQLWKVIDARGSATGTTETIYNARGQTQEITGTATYRQVFGYDAYGDQETLQTFGTVPATTTWVRDPATGLLTFKKYADNKGTHYNYTADGKIAQRIWQRGITTTYGYSSTFGDLATINYSDNSTPAVEFSNYDLYGRPGTVIEKRGTFDDTTTLTYDPITGAQSTTYAANHSILPNLSVIANAPENGRVTGHSVKQGQTPIHGWTFDYDDFGRIDELTAGNTHVDYLYQPGTRLVKDQVTKLNGQIIHRSTRGIDMLGRSTGMVSRAPDPANGNAERIVASVGHSYDAIHRRKDAKREDGTRWDYGYNFKSEVTTANKLLSNSQLVPGQNFAYDYDEMGNRKTSSAGGATTGYTSNGLNQYTSITTPGAVDVLSRSPGPVTATIDGQSASITQQGNLYNARATLTNAPNGKYYTSSITSGTSTQTGSRWLAPASVTPQYDDDGNLTSDGRWTYTWDAENRLVKMTTRPTAISAGAPNVTLDYTNDFKGRRIAEKTTTLPAVGIPSVSETRFLYESWNSVAEFSKSGTTGGPPVLSKTLLWGLDLSGTPQGAGGVSGLLLITAHSAPLTSYLPSYDSNGNINAWTNSTGQLIRRQDYDPFGNLTLREEYATIANLDEILNDGFSTKPKDVITGMLYYGHRFYDPLAGRWLSRDPIEEEGRTNLYGFVGNDGTNNFDLLGMFGYSELEIAKSILGQSNLSEDAKVEINSFRFQGHGDLPNYMSDGHDGRGESVSKGFDWTLADNKIEYKNKHPYHFLSTEEAQAKVDEAIKMGNRTEFELYMHSLQDSYVHKGRGHKVGPVNQDQYAWCEGEMSAEQKKDERYTKLKVGHQIIYLSPDLNNVAWHQAKAATELNIAKWNKANNKKGPPGWWGW